MSIRGRRAARALRAFAGALLLPAFLWAAPAVAQTEIELVCPCTAETANLTSVNLTFGVRNLLTDRDTGPLRAYLEGRQEEGSWNYWVTLATVHLPAAAAGATVESRTHTVAFRHRLAGTWQLRLRVMGNSHEAMDSIYWLADPVEDVNGGSSYSSVYFDGTPTVAIRGGNATLDLPALKNPEGGTWESELSVELIATAGLNLDLEREAIATHAYGADLAAGAEIAAAQVTAALGSTGSHGYLQLQLINGDGKLVAYETVAAPDGESLPVRPIDTPNADILADGDEDGVSDVNERLMETDPGDAVSSPGDSTIDVLALYSAGFADAFEGEPSTRIRHVLTLADTIFSDSEVDASLRLVGISEIDLDESSAFNNTDPDTARKLIELHGADVVVMFRSFDPGGPCGWAYIGGVLSNGTGVYDFADQRVVHVFAGCGARTAAHEIGHLMGLGHSYAQDSVGAFRWSRGHGVEEQFVTVMAYGSAYNTSTDINQFSDPDGDCEGLPCGVAVGQPDGADAVASLNATRFQVANFAQAKPDTDGDGFVDPVDALPEDASEQFDSDGDGTGDNADDDDDNDGVADLNDAFPYDPAEWADTDGDSVGDNADAFPGDRFESVDSDGDGVGDNGDRFPHDPTETVDTDNDGVGNNADAFPFDTRDWLDTDGDGTGDNLDTDDDNDGVADTDDHYPLDAGRDRISSYRFTVTDRANHEQSVAPAGDTDGDGKGDLLVGLVGLDRGDDESPWSSAAYLVASADLAAADAADGAADQSVNLASIADRPGSWKFIGEDGQDQAGYSLAPAGDIDGDGRDDVIIGAPGHDRPGNRFDAGAAYVIAASALPAADAADGETDGVVELGNIASQANSWKIIGESERDEAGATVGLAGDLDGDGLEELYVGASGHDGRRGAVYLLSPARLSATDLADGTGDGTISLGEAAAQSGSWKLTGEDADDQAGSGISATARDNAGNAALLVTSENYKEDGIARTGSAYLVSSADLASIDAADGSTDGVARLGRVAAAANSWQFVGIAGDGMRGGAGLGDIDGDDVADIFLESGSRAFLISGADMAGLGKDGESGGIIRPHGMDAPNSWQAELHFPVGSPAAPANLDGDGIPDLAVLSSPDGWLVSGTDLAAARGKANLYFSDVPSRSRSWQAAAGPGFGDFIQELTPAGDVDGDGLDDTLMIAANNQVFLLASADLRVLDGADSATNGRIGLGQLAGDTDGDGIGNIIDGDDDGDGYRDFEDRFPQDADDWRDTDGDGVGDNSDAFPRDYREQRDTDGDGTGDNADTDDDNDGVPDIDDGHPLDTDDDGVGNALDGDDDGDGVADTADAFPLDSSEWADTDGDGTGNNADTDDDGDGTADADDALPLDPEETADADGDGTGDNADAFPYDARETGDADGDGTGNNADTDDDNDGVADDADAFPYDASEWADSDGDGVGDNADVFPNDAAEWADTDGDGTGNNADTDDDGDSYTDGADAFPLDPGRTRLFTYRLAGENTGALAGLSVDAGDIGGGARADVLIGAPGTTQIRDLFAFRPAPYGAAYALSGLDFERADEADGLADHAIRLENIAAQPSSNAVSGEFSGDEAGESLALIGDLDGDGREEWLVGAPFADGSAGAAYLVSPADLEAADALHGADGNARIQDLIQQSGSWMFYGEGTDTEVGRRVSRAGDVNGDGGADFLIGAPRYGDDSQGAVYLVSGEGFGAADAADGVTDRRIDLGGIAGRDGSWKFTGEPRGGSAGRFAGRAGDIDGDGMADIIIGAPYHTEGGRSSRGAVYLIAAADLTAADKAGGDGADGIISLSDISAQSASWKLLGEDRRNHAGWAALTADTDGDGNLELIVGAPGNEANQGAVYLLPISSLKAADDADGASDRVVDLGQVAALPHGYKFTGGQAYSGLFGGGSGAGGAVAAADLDGDGRAELIIGAEDHQQGGVWCPEPGEQRQSGAVYAISSLDFAGADSADGVDDGVARLANVAGLPNSRQLLGEPTDRMGGSISAGADLNGDGRADLVMGGPGQFNRHGDCGESSGAGVTVLISGAELTEADRRDGAEDGVVDLEALRQAGRAVDFDFDGTENELDRDDDGDGVSDGDDAFPLDPSESGDNDFDGIGDNADPDDDNDGTLDRLDAFPFDPYETTDTDGDGTGDNADPDGDGAPDNADIDTDGDGTADSEDADDDGDGVEDADDLYPLDATRSDLYFYRIAGQAIGLANTDYDGDGMEDLVVNSAKGVTFLVSSADLEEADGADGAEDRVVDLDQDSVPANSWKLNASRHDQIFGAGDVDSDGKDDLIVHDLLVSASSLPAEDNAHTTGGDRVLRLSAPSAERDPGIWRLEGTRLDWGVFSLADLNSDSRQDLLVGSPWRDVDSEPQIDAVYVASGADWQSADTLDGAADGRISLDEVAERSGSWKIESETDISMGASIGPAGDVNGDGHPDLLLGAPDMTFGTNPDSGGAIVISGAAMSSLDAADGAEDGEIMIRQAGQEGIWKLGGKDIEIGEAVSAAGDTDGDGLDDILFNGRSAVDLVTGAAILNTGGAIDPAASGTRRFLWWRYGLGAGDIDADGLSDFLLGGYFSIYLVSGRDLPGLGGAGGEVDFRDGSVPPHSWRLIFRNRNSEFTEPASMADLDGDGKPELIMPVQLRTGENGEVSGEDATYIVSLAELPLLDIQDGKADSRIYLDRLARRWTE